MTVERGCAGVWFAFGWSRVIDEARATALVAEERKHHPRTGDKALRRYVLWKYGEAVRVTYRVSRQLTGEWSVRETTLGALPPERVAAECPPVEGFDTLREALFAANAIRIGGYDPVAA